MLKTLSILISTLILLMIGVEGCKKEVIIIKPNPLLQPLAPDTMAYWNQWNNHKWHFLDRCWGEYRSISMAPDSSIWIIIGRELIHGNINASMWTTSQINNYYLHSQIKSSITAVDEHNAWICDPDSGIYYTNDGGLNWLLINKEMTYTYYIHFFDIKEGVCIRIPGYQNWSVLSQEVYTSNDGGTNWN